MRRMMKCLSILTKMVERHGKDVRVPDDDDDSASRSICFHIPGRDGIRIDRETGNEAENT